MQDVLFSLAGIATGLDYEIALLLQAENAIEPKAEQPHVFIVLYLKNTLLVNLLPTRRGDDQNEIEIPNYQPGESIGVDPTTRQSFTERLVHVFTGETPYQLTVVSRELPRETLDLRGGLDLEYHGEGVYAARPLYFYTEET